MERFLNSDIWNSREAFTINDIVQQLEMPKSVAGNMVHQLSDYLAKEKHPTGKVTYHRLMTHSCLHMKMASNPEFVYGSREWV
jgi:hypothetical protein